MALALIPAAAAAASALSLAKSGKRRRRPAKRSNLVVTQQFPRRNGGAAPITIINRGGSRKRKGNPKGGSVKRSRITLSHPFNVSVPASTSQVSGPFSFGISALSGPTADFDRRDALTVNGSLEYPFAVRTGSDYAEDSKNGGLSTSIALAVDELRPATLSGNTGKLYALAGCFSHYRMRHLRFRFVPAQASTNTAQVYMAYWNDPDQAGYTSLTGVSPAVTREFNTSVVTPSWQPATMEMSFAGTRCWTNDATDSIDECNQGMLLVVVRGGAASITYGRIEVDYTIDLFGVRAYTASSSPEVRGKGVDIKDSAPLLKVNDASASASVGKDEKSRYVRVDNDDVKSLYDESEQRAPLGFPLLRRTDPIPIPRPAITSKTQDGNGKKPPT